MAPVPRVTMNGAMRPLVVRVPTAHPQPTARAHPATSARMMDGMEPLKWFVVTSMRPPVIAAIEPTERSMPPVMMTNVMPTSMQPIEDTCLSTLPTVLISKNCGWRTSMNSSRTASATHGPYCSMLKLLMRSLSESLAGMGGSSFLEACCQEHDVFLVDVLPLDESGQLTTTHDGNVIAQTDDFGKLWGDDNAGLALPGEVIDESVDHLLRVDVDTTCRFVEDHDLGLDLHGFGQRDFLLVAARQVSHELGDRLAPDVERLNVLCRRPALGLPVHKRMAILAQRHDRDVLGDVHVDDEAGALTVLGQVHDVMSDRLVILTQPDLLTHDRDAAAGSFVAQSHQCFHEFRAAGADKARESQDFAFAQLEGDVLENAGYGQVPDVQHDIVTRERLRRIELLELPTNHQASHVLFRDVADVACRDAATVPKDRHCITDLLHFLETMTDVEDGDALFLELTDACKQYLDLVVGQDRGWFVHDQDLRVVGKCLGDLDHLFLRDRETCYRRPRIRAALANLCQQ